MKYGEDDPVHNRGVRKGRPIEDTGKPVSVNPKGRPCSVPGCITVLSQYNPASTCYFHTLKKLEGIDGRSFKN